MTTRKKPTRTSRDTVRDALGVEPQRSVTIASRTRITLEAVRLALRALRAAGEAELVGFGRGAAWRRAGET